MGMCACSVIWLCPILCDSIDCSLPASSVRGISLGRILEWVAISFSGDLPNPGTEPRSPALQVDSLQSEPTGKRGRNGHLKNIESVDL